LLNTSCFPIKIKGFRDFIAQIRLIKKITLMRNILGDEMIVKNLKIWRNCILIIEYMDKADIHDLVIGIKLNWMID